MARKSALKKPAQAEYDSVYFLKILLYLILGTIWILLNDRRSVPVGLIIGIILAQHEKLQLDRKIEYAILLIGAVLGLVGIGIAIHL